MNTVVTGVSTLTSLLMSLLLLGATACESSKETKTAPQATATAAPLAEDSQAAAPLVAPGVRFNPRLLRRFKPSRSFIESAQGMPSEALRDLGRMLYYDKRLSRGRDLSCNSCHELSKYGVDGLRTSKGHQGKFGRRNAPSVYHAAGHFAQLWDGRAATVEEQALLPILNPLEMAAESPEHVVQVLADLPGYVEAFKHAFPAEATALTFANVGIAIAAFERGLVTRSRWDDYVEGKQAALSTSEIEGLKTFTAVGCMVCHTGEFLGGNSYQHVGVIDPWPNQEDLGRFEVTLENSDMMRFKVPTLRNVAKTAPYFHDGSGATLADAVSMMGKHQLGIELSAAEVSSIVSWLNSLTGELPKAYIKPPTLPTRTPD